MYAFEFELDRPAAEALTRIAQEDYLGPYANSVERLIAVGIRFASGGKRVGEWLTDPPWEVLENVESL